MPQVPTYDGPQVRTQALQPVFQRAPDVSSGAQAIARGLGQVAEVADQRAQRDAQDEAFALEARIRSDWQKQRAKLREQYKGEQADQYGAAASEWWAKARETYGAEASPMARRLATRAIGQYALSAEADTLGYVEGEKKRTREINYRTVQQARISDALSQVTPDTAVVIGERVAKEVTEAAIAYATAEGLDGAKVGAQLAREQLDKMHTSVALALAGRPGGGDAAKAYLARFGGSMDAADRTRVLDMVDVEATRAKTEAVRNTVGGMMLGIERGQFPKRAEVDALAAVDPMAAAQVQRAINAEMKARKAEAQGTSVKTDLGAYFELRDKILAGQPVNLLEYRDRVGRGDLEEAKKLQESMSKPKEAKDALTLSQHMASYSKKLTPNMGKRFEAAALQEIVKFQDEKGRAPNQSERTALFDALMVKGVVEDNFLYFDTKMPVYQMTPEQRAKAKIPQQPAAAPAAPPRVKSIEEARALKPGTLFIDPEGVERVR